MNLMTKIINLYICVLIFCSSFKKKKRKESHWWCRRLKNSQIQLNLNTGHYVVLVATKARKLFIGVFTTRKTPYWSWRVIFFHTTCWTIFGNFIIHTQVLEQNNVFLICSHSDKPDSNMSAIHTNLIHELFIWIYLQIMFLLRLGFLLCKCINFHPKAIKSCLYHSQALSSQISSLFLCLFFHFFKIWSLLWWELAQKNCNKDALSLFTCQGFLGVHLHHRSSTRQSN